MSHENDSAPSSIEKMKNKFIDEDFHKDKSQYVQNNKANASFDTKVSNKRFNISHEIDQSPPKSGHQYIDEIEQTEVSFNLDDSNENHRPVFEEIGKNLFDRISYQNPEFQQHFSGAISESFNLSMSSDIIDSKNEISFNDLDSSKLKTYLLNSLGTITEIYYLIRQIRKGTHRELDPNSKSCSEISFHNSQNYFSYSINFPLEIKQKIFDELGLVENILINPELLNITDENNFIAHVTDQKLSYKINERAIIFEYQTFDVKEPCIVEKNKYNLEAVINKKFQNRFEDKELRLYPKQFPGFLYFLPSFKNMEFSTRFIPNLDSVKQVIQNESFQMQFPLISFRSPKILFESNKSTVKLIKTGIRPDLFAIRLIKIPIIQEMIEENNLKNAEKFLNCHFSIFFLDICQNVIINGNTDIEFYIKNFFQVIRSLSFNDSLTSNIRTYFQSQFNIVENIIKYIKEAIHPQLKNKKGIFEAKKIFDLTFIMQFIYKNFSFPLNFVMDPTNLNQEDVNILLFNEIISFSSLFDNYLDLIDFKYSNIPELKNCILLDIFGNPIPFKSYESNNFTNLKRENSVINLIKDKFRGKFNEQDFDQFSKLILQDKLNEIKDDHKLILISDDQNHLFYGFINQKTKYQINYGIKVNGDMEGFLIKIQKGSLNYNFFVKQLFCCSNYFNDHFNKRIQDIQNSTVKISQNSSNQRSFDFLEIQTSTFPLVYHNNLWIEILGYVILENLDLCPKLMFIKSFYDMKTYIITEGLDKNLYEFADQSGSIQENLFKLSNNVQLFNQSMINVHVLKLFVHYILLFNDFHDGNFAFKFVTLLFKQKESIPIIQSISLIDLWPCPTFLHVKDLFLIDNLNPTDIGERQKTILHKIYDIFKSINGINQKYKFKNIDFNYFMPTLNYLTFRKIIGQIFDKLNFASKEITIMNDKFITSIFLSKYVSILIEFISKLDIAFTQFDNEALNVYLNHIICNTNNFINYLSKLLKLDKELNGVQISYYDNNTTCYDITTKKTEMSKWDCKIKKDFMVDKYLLVLITKRELTNEEIHDNVMRISSNNSDKKLLNRVYIFNNPLDYDLFTIKMIKNGAANLLKYYI